VYSEALIESTILRSWKVGLRLFLFATRTKWKPVKSIALFAAVILISGCSNRESQQTAMRQRFATIDSNFANDIWRANTNEQAMVQEQIDSFSNAIMALALSPTNLLLASNQLEEAIGREGMNTLTLIKVVRAGSDTKRAEFTNAMLAAKLHWFYTNDYPQTQIAPSNNDLNIVENASVALYRARKDDLVKAGLKEMRVFLERMTNDVPTPMPLTADEIQRQKKDERMAEIERQRQASAEQLKLWREQQAARATGVTLSGEVFQVINDGMLVKYNLVYGEFGVSSYDLGLIQDCNSAGFADGSRFRSSFVYPIGTYRYDTAGGSTKTVKRFTASISRAVEWLRNPQ